MCEYTRTLATELDLRRPPGVAKVGSGIIRLFFFFSS